MESTIVEEYEVHGTNGDAKVMIVNLQEVIQNQESNMQRNLCIRLLFYYDRGGKVNINSKMKKLQMAILQSFW